jgi:hypothetical protein
MKVSDQQNWSGEVTFESYAMGGGFVVLRNGEAAGFNKLTVSKRFIRFVRKGG